MGPKKEDKPILGNDCNQRSPGPMYLLPTLTGYKGHAINKNRGPRYTMRARTGEHLDVKGPGPQYDVRDITRFGKHNMPKFTLRQRAPAMRRQDTPGPGAYAPEKFPFPKYDRPPAYTLRGQLKGRRPDDLPAPNAYILPTCIGPRRPHVQSLPEYSLRPALPGLKKSMTPGPPDYGVPSVKQTKPRVPQVKIVRPTNFRAVPGTSRTPAPCDYFPLYDTTARPPKFAFGVKHGPCAPPYILPLDNAQFR